MSHLSIDIVSLSFKVASPAQEGNVPRTNSYTKSFDSGGASPSFKETSPASKGNVPRVNPYKYPTDCGRLGTPFPFGNYNILKGGRGGVQVWGLGSHHISAKHCTSITAQTGKGKSAADQAKVAQAARHIAREVAATILRMLGSFVHFKVALPCEKDSRKISGVTFPLLCNCLSHVSKHSAVNTILLATHFYGRTIQQMPLSQTLCLTCLLLLESRSPNLLGKCEHFKECGPRASREKKRTDNLYVAGLLRVILFARIHRADGLC